MSEIRIQVKGYLTYRETIGKKQILLPREATLRALLQGLQDQLDAQSNAQIFGYGGELLPSVAVLINGRHHTHLPERLDIRLKDGDEVAIFPPIAGGES